jgi:hypothetical protein
MEEIDIWRTATLLMRLHGDGATFNAARRADALLDKGDETGFAVWMKVVHAIEQLERQTPRDGEAVN